MISEFIIIYLDFWLNTPPLFFPYWRKDIFGKTAMLEDS